MNVVWTLVAAERLAWVAKEIAADRPAAAVDWVETMLAAAARLQTFPESGRLVPEFLGSEVREVIAGRYRIIYRIDPAQITVLTVRHQRQSTTRDDVPGLG